MPPASSIGDRETVVAIVAPVGSPVDVTVDALTEAFGQSGYTVEPVRISELIDSTEPTLPGEESTNRARLLMDKGDRLRTRLDADDACAYLATQAIQRSRKAATGSNKSHRPRFVNLVRSLKTPDEVRLLRAIYGQRVIVIGVSASEQQRTKELTRQLTKTGMPRQTAAAEATSLLHRDERDEGTAHGQRMRDAYRLSDAFLAAKTTRDDPETQRLVHLLLGEPWITPSRDEQGMFQAWAAKFRSSAAGRQVGAAIVDDLGELICVGCNDVPRPFGGQFWPDHSDDRRDFKLGYDANEQGMFNTVEELFRGLTEADWLTPDIGRLDPKELAQKALASKGPLDKTRVTDLIEFGRVIHAEMAALMTAAREGRAVRNGTLYTTTYPCHECARLIIAAGIGRVVFIDPYEKSLAADLYEEMWDDSQKSGRVLVEAFVGVSPRMFWIFEMSNRLRDETGAYRKWDNGLRALVTRDEEFTDSIPEQENAAGARLAVLVEAAKVGRHVPDEEPKAGAPSKPGSSNHPGRSTRKVDPSRSPTSTTSVPKRSAGPRTGKRSGR